MIIIMEFNIGDKVVYPSYGLGEILKIESKTIYGVETKMYVISFNEGKVLLSVPLQKSHMLRFPIAKTQVPVIYDILQQEPDVLKGGIKTNQIYENRINSGDLSLVAQTARDVYKKINDSAKISTPVYTYNQKRLLDLAVKLMSDEISQAENIDHKTIKEKILSTLQQSKAIHNA